jgi:hypothetical protein
MFQICSQYLPIIHIGAAQGAARTGCVAPRRPHAQWLSLQNLGSAGRGARHHHGRTSEESSKGWRHYDFGGVDGISACASYPSRSATSPLSSFSSLTLASILLRLKSFNDTFGTISHASPILHRSPRHRWQIPVRHAPKVLQTCSDVT